MAIEQGGGQDLPPKQPKGDTPAFPALPDTGRTRDAFDQRLSISGEPPADTRAIAATDPRKQISAAVPTPSDSDAADTSATPKDAKTGVPTPDPRVAVMAEAILDPKTARPDRIPPLHGTRFITFGVVRDTPSADQNDQGTQRTYLPVTHADTPILDHFVGLLRSGGLDVSQVDIERDFAIEMINKEPHLRLLRYDHISEVIRSQPPAKTQSEPPTTTTPEPSVPKQRRESVMQEEPSEEPSAKPSTRTSARTTKPPRSTGTDTDTGRTPKDAHTIATIKALHERGSNPEEFEKIKAEYVRDYFIRTVQDSQNPQAQRKALQAFYNITSQARALYGSEAVPDQRGGRPLAPEKLELLEDLMALGIDGAREKYIERTLDVNLDADLAIVGRNFTSLVAELQARFPDVEISRGRTETLATPDTPSAQPSTDILDGPMALGALTGKRLEIAVYADAIKQNCGDLAAYLTEHEIAVLRTFVDPDLKNYSEMAEQLQLSKKTLYDLGQRISEKLEHTIPVGTTATRVQLEIENGTSVPLVGLSQSGIHSTLVQLKREALVAHPESLYSRLQQMSTRIEKVGREVVAKITEGVGQVDEYGQSREFIHARTDLVILYSRTIVQALADYADLVPEQIDDIAQVVIDDLPDRIPAVLARAEKAQANTDRNSTGVMLNRFVRQIIASYIAQENGDIPQNGLMGEDRAMFYHRTLREAASASEEPTATVIIQPQPEPLEPLAVPSPKRSQEVRRELEERMITAINENPKINRAELAREMGLPKATMSRWEEILRSEGKITGERSTGRQISPITQSIITAFRIGASPESVRELVRGSYPDIDDDRYTAIVKKIRNNYAEMRDLIPVPERAARQRTPETQQIMADFTELRGDADSYGAVRERAWTRLLASNPNADRSRFEHNFGALISTLRKEHPELNIPLGWLKNPTDND